jgi:hypothetical protein
VREVAQEAIARARRGDGPTLIEAETYRYRGHSLADPDELRSKEEKAKYAVSARRGGGRRGCMRGRLRGGARCGSLGGQAGVVAEVESCCWCPCATEAASLTAPCLPSPPPPGARPHPPA